MNTLLLTQYILFLSIGYCFFAGLITRNYSQVDRLWSILPPIYVLIWMFDYLDNPRYIIAASIIIFWGIRLTSNFAVKGGYRFSFNKGFYGEDYRWEVLRKKIPNRFLFEIFNLFFISGFQLILIYLFTLPVYYLGMYTGPIKGIEILLFFIHVFLLTTETIADLQQLNYYKKRNSENWKSDKRIQLGFNTFGLWRYSRHPNYICEIAQWIVIYLYLQVNHGFHYSFTGCSVLLILFIGSTIMAESITLSKHSGYKEWKKVTPPWIPFIDLPFRYSKRKLFF